VPDSVAQWQEVNILVPAHRLPEVVPSLSDSSKTLLHIFIPPTPRRTSATYSSTNSIQDIFTGSHLSSCTRMDAKFALKGGCVYSGRNSSLGGRKADFVLQVYINHLNFFSVGVYICTGQLCLRRCLYF
jgi:hypothetical protein